MGKKSTPAAPAAPDAAATATAQGEANTKAAVAQANLNRIDQYTPQGSITYAQTGTNADGTPKYTQTQAYSADQQKLYDQNNQVSTSLNDLAINNIDKVAAAQSKDFNYDGMTPQVTSVNGGNIQSSVADAGKVQGSVDYSKLSALPQAGTFGTAAQKASDTAYAAAASRLDPQYSQQQSDITSRLANSGIAVGSDAYNREMDNFSRAKTDAYGQAQNNAYAQGLSAQNQQYTQELATRQQGVDETNTQGTFANSAQNQQYSQNQSNAAFANNAQNQTYNQAAGNAALANSGRQQEIQEATYLRNLPLNDIASLLGTGSGVQNPTFSDVAQVGVAAPDYQGAVYANYNAANSQYNTQQQAKSSALGSVFGLAGSLGAAAISDRRAKENIKRIGTLANGLATYTYNYIGNASRQFGVMAQEALGVVPDAVGVTDNGTLYVDYAKVWNVQ